jgi:hypothetical protein
MHIVSELTLFFELFEITLNDQEWIKYRLFVTLLKESFSNIQNRNTE